MKNVINYLDAREAFEKRINGASEKQQENLSKKIYKLGEWIDTSLRGRVRL